jgi:hypothetical protein
MSRSWSGDRAPVGERSWRRWAVVVLASALSIAACATTGCSRSTEFSSTGGASALCSCEGTKPAQLVDQALVAFLSKARAAHLQADALESGDAAGAIRALEAVVNGPLPPGKAPEVDEVVADTRARLAELRAGTGAFDAARADVQAGLARVPTVSYFRGHLYEVLGFVEEKDAAAKAAAGDTAGAEAAKKRAIAASKEAVSIQDEVIQRALGKEKPTP